MSKSYTKICGVCDDKACTHNYGAIVCDACKIFFRRNATKLHKFKCPHVGNCKVSKPKRTSCRRCRLEKCYSIGMKKKCILDENENKIRAHKIEQNRMLCKPASLNVTLVDSSSSSCNSTSSTLIDSTSMSPEDNLCHTKSSINNLANSNELTSTSPVIFHVNTENSLDELNINKLEEVNYKFIQDETEKKSKSMETQLSVIPFTKTIFIHHYNELECNYMMELLCTSALMTTPTSKVTLIIQKLDHAAKIIQSRKDYYFGRFVNILRQLSSFKQFSKHDQLIMLKKGGPEIHFMRSVLTFDYEKQGLVLNLDDNNSMFISLELLKQSPRRLYDAYKSYFQQIQGEWQHDSFIIDLLMAIILFDPNREHLIDKEVLRFQQMVYMYLLQRYLYMKCGDECETKAKFLSLMNIIKDVQNLNGIFRIRGKSEFNMLGGPLYSEILDQ